MNLEKQVLEKAMGEHRLDPDQQRRYLGTFAERVVLVGTRADAKQAALLANFPQILEAEAKAYQPLALKISAKLDSKTEMTLLKAAQNLSLPATIVEEDKADSPFGFVLHTDRALDLAVTDVTKRYPDLFAATEQTPEKKGFWKKLFG